MAEPERGGVGAGRTGSTETRSAVTEATLKADRNFIISSTIIWLAALGVTAWDFISRGNAFELLISITGIVLIAAGIGIRLAARRTLGPYFVYTLRIIPGHRLIKSGIYSHIRHPGYAGDLVFDFGLPLTLSSTYGFLVMLLLIPCMIYRIGAEERMLLEHFGHEYREYMMSTKRLIPGIY